MRCAVCGASLLVDVVITRPLSEERVRFLVARDLALLGPPAPPFSEARRALERAGWRLVQGISRAFALQVLELLQQYGATATLQPTAPPPEPSRRALPATMIATALTVGLGLWLWRPEPEPTVQRAPAALVAPPQPAAPAALSTEEIVLQAAPGTVRLQCGDQAGAGFFVEPELVLTNAHVACPPGQPMEVLLEDGRQLVGATEERDEDLDLATVRVPGAEGTPLRQGDPTLLAPGEKIVFIGSPKGLAFTVHEGRVSYVGREYLGVGYVQFDASVHPGHSGGPLLNGRGEVVGVVSLKVLGEGMGLALPLPYASRLARVPQTPEAEQRWQALLERVAREEERTLERYRFPPGRPALAGVEHSASLGLVAVLLERFESPPGPLAHRLELVAGEERCGVEVKVEHWHPLLEAATRGGDRRRLRWLISRRLTEGLYMGLAVLRVEGCKLPAEGKGWLTVPGGVAGLDRFPVSLQAVASARPATPEPPPSP